MSNIFPLHAIDFYKTGHKDQYPENTMQVYSNLTPRSSRLASNLVLDDYDNRVVFLGLQIYIQRVLIDNWDQEFFNKPLEKVIKKYKRRMDTSLGKGVVKTDHIKALWELGYLPIHIKALPEGSRVNVGVPMFTVVSTMEEFYWLTNYLETDMSSEIWKPCTTATLAYEYKRLLLSYAEKTCSSLDHVAIQGHDFSCRGMSGREDAMKSGLGHLLSFIGTDTVLAIDAAEDYYSAGSPVGVSVPATEHSVMCMGTEHGELQTIKRLITEVYPSGIVSIVSDTWDFWNTLTNIAAQLKDDILNRGVNELGLGKVVFRPDSGDPANILCGRDIIVTYDDDIDAVLDDYGIDLNMDRVALLDNGKYYAVNVHYDKDDFPHYYKDYELTENEVKGAVQCLWDIFAGHTNNKGYKELHDKVGLIYGDSITLNRAKDILERLEARGFASSCVVFGIGSFTYQYLTRDTFGFAIKATAGIVNNEFREIYKDPKTANGSKKSAKGLLRVENCPDGNGFVLFDQQTLEQEKQGLLKTVFHDGCIQNLNQWEDMKENLEK